MNMPDPENNPIDGGLAAYMADAVEQLTLLNEIFRALRWRIHRGDSSFFQSTINDARRQTRKLMHALDMMRSCNEYDQQPMDEKRRGPDPSDNVDR